MELERNFWAENHILRREPCIAESENKDESTASQVIILSKASDDFCNHPELFKKLLEMGVPLYDSVDAKLAWLRSQIIGDDAEFDSPFGRRRLLYADHTASGRSLHHSEHFILHHLLPFYGNTHTCDGYVGSQTTKMVHEATDYIKKCLSGGPDDALIFCGSGATAAIKRLQEVMAIAVPSILRDRVLKMLSPRERWIVFVGPHEHHSNLLSWRQCLAEVIEIGLDDEGLLDLHSLKLKLEEYKNTSRPILGSFSSCSNVTGIYSDTRAIARLLHQYNGFACFDFAASGPYAKIEMRSGESDGYDAVFVSPHKFLGGPGSPGVLLMSKALYRLGSSPPSTCGGGTVSYVNGFNEKDTLYLESIEERENGGTPQIIQSVRASLAFWFKEYIGYEAIETREQSYINRALERLLPNPNIRVLGNLSAKRQAILSFLIYTTTNSSSVAGKNEGRDDDIKEEKEGQLNLWAESVNKRGKPLTGPFVATLLNDLFGIQARGGCACAGPYGHELLNINKSQSLAIRSAVEEGYVGVKPGWTRISFPYYMIEEDFEFILTAVEFIADYGQRFLPLYSFNLRNGSWKLKTQELGKEDDGNFLIHLLEKEGKARRNASYIEAAMCMANRLPKFPAPSILPGNIDPSVLHFRA